MEVVGEYDDHFLIVDFALLEVRHQFKEVVISLVYVVNG